MFTLQNLIIYLYTHKMSDYDKDAFQKGVYTLINALEQLIDERTMEYLALRRDGNSNAAHAKKYVCFLNAVKNYTDDLFTSLIAGELK